MKDAYSFHAGEESLEATYQDMRRAYERIFSACGLDFVRVEADSGTIGGSVSHEFMVTAQTGESVVVQCLECGYGANQERADSGKLEAPGAGGDSEMAKVATPGMHTVEEVAGFLGVEPRQLVKTLIYETDSGAVAVAIRGDREVNEVKLGNFLDTMLLELAGDARIEEVTGAPVGFAGPVGLGDGIRLLADESVREVGGFVCGANEGDAHLTGVSWGRDSEPDAWGDFMLVEAGDACPRCGANLTASRGIEVGHIFKLGRKYSEPMGCTYADETGANQAMDMGCYGLGIGRTVAAAIEQNHDDQGIIWPVPLAPFEVVIVPLGDRDENVVQVAESLYTELRRRGVDVLLDDRPERPGVKFKDADLIGFPVRVVIGSKSLADGNVEVSLRKDGERQLVPAGHAADRVAELLLDEMP
jgi:prolyl-tRNA synthetase